MAQNPCIEDRLQSLLLGTWQPVAALAAHAGVPTKTALAILQRRMHDWHLDCVRVRIDAHNPVHCFRKASQTRILIMNVWVPVAETTEEES